MSRAVSAQVDVGNLSLAGLGQFSTILAAVSADDVQPMALIQLQNLGAAFPVSGPATIKVPDYLNRFNSTRIERLGITVGWRKGDSASLMAQSSGGQAVSLIAVCLSNIYRDSVGEILHSLSAGVLPQAACLSSPMQLDQAAGLLANKLALIGFGTTLAKHICRIHEAYELMQLSVPSNLLEVCRKEWIAELLGTISCALRDEKGQVQIRGCCGMGYIYPLVVTLFSDDCTVTIEKLVVHQGHLSCSISVEIIASMQDEPIQVLQTQQISSVTELLCTSRYEKDDDVMHSLITADFKWKGLIPALLQTTFQQFNIVCPPDLIPVVGLCVLSGADVTYVYTEGAKVDKTRSNTRRFPAKYLLGENHRILMHQRCETILNTNLPNEWPPYPDCLRQLNDLMGRLFTQEQDGSANSDKTPTMPSGDRFMISVLDIIESAFAAVFVNASENATWRQRSQANMWITPGWGRPGRLQFPLSSHLLWKPLFDIPKPYLIAGSNGTSTLIPWRCINLQHEDLCQYRGMELIDGPIKYGNRYHYYLQDFSSRFERPCPSQPSNFVSPLMPTAQGIHSDLSFTVSERTHTLLLRTTMTVSGQKIDVCFGDCLDRLVYLDVTEPCEHARATPLKDEYSQFVQTASVEAPGPPKEPSDTISIVQTAGNPTAQLLSLSLDSAILCHYCCLNCVYEQARSKGIRKIILA
jgi:hypothetical protein